MRRPSRQALPVAAGTALALMALIIVATARSTPILHSPALRPNLHLPSGDVTLSRPPARYPQPKPSHPGSSLVGDIVFGLIAFSLIVGLGCLLVLSVLSCIRRVRRRLGQVADEPLPDADDAVLDAVADAAARQQRRLNEGAPANAIIACWVDLEHAVADAGVEKRPSETSAELTVRVLGALDVDGRTLHTLGALYREARFSAHAVGEQQRESALVALATLRQSLPSHTREQV